MRLSPFQLFSCKLTVFAVVLLYLGVDLLVWQGPVWRFIHEAQARKDTTNLVASVYGEDLTVSQWARHSAEQAWLSGRSTVDPQKRAKYLMELIRQANLRITTRYNDRNLPLLREQAEDEVSRLATRAGGDKPFETWLTSQGYTRSQFTDKVQSRLREQAQLERAIAPHCEVTDEAVARHYELVKSSLTRPEHREVSHIFISTVDTDAAEAEQRAKELYARLQAGEDFANLARESSEDEHSAPRGGQLGKIYNDGESSLPELPLFGEGSIAAGQPRLVQSRWGWHILLAGPLQPAVTPGLDECRESLRTAIMSAQQELATASYFDASYQEGKHKKHIKIYVK